MLHQFCFSITVWKSFGFCHVNVAYSDFYQSLFVSASHQTGLDTSSMTRRSIMVIFISRRVHFSFSVSFSFSSPLQCDENLKQSLVLAREWMKLKENVLFLFHLLYNVTRIWNKISCWRENEWNWKKTFFFFFVFISFTMWREFETKSRAGERMNETERKRSFSFPFSSPLQCNENL